MKKGWLGKLLCRLGWHSWGRIDLEWVEKIEKSNGELLWYYDIDPGWCVEVRHEVCWRDGCKAKRVVRNIGQVIEVPESDNFPPIGHRLKETVLRARLAFCH